MFNRITLFCFVICTRSIYPVHAFVARLLRSFASLCYALVEGVLSKAWLNRHSFHGMLSPALFTTMLSSKRSWFPYLLPLERNNADGVNEMLLWSLQTLKVHPFRHECREMIVDLEKRKRPVLKGIVHWKNHTVCFFLKKVCQ